MENTNPVFLKAQMLIAMPALADPNFSHSVTCICEHSGAGAVGIIINRLHPFLSGKEVFDELKIDCSPDMESIPIHIGGPVHMGEVFVLHGPPFDWESCLTIAPFLGLSNTKDILQDIAQGKMGKSFIIALGCAGWGQDQLETEIKANAWITCPASKDLVFEVPVESRWKEAMKKVGIDPLLLSNTAGRA